MTKLENETSRKSAKLSVVVISLYSHALLRNCLESILANEHQDKIEIIVADYYADEPISNLIAKYPNVRFVHFSEKVGIPILSAAGIAQSTGEIIALIDSSCVVDVHWITSILAAHQSPSPVIGGAVEIRGQMKLVDWAAYFCEYGQFMNPLKSGVVDVLPGNNISFKRPALQKGHEYVEPEFWKTYWCEKLKAEGIELISEPTMLIYYAKNFKLVPFLIRRFHHGRCFAGMRVMEAAFSKRAFYLVGSLTLPFIFLYRTVAVVLGKKRFFRELLLAFPFIVLAIVFWSLGETCGYLAGTGKSCEYIY